MTEERGTISAILDEYPEVSEALHGAVLIGRETPFVLAIDARGRASVLQCLLSNADVVTHLRFVADSIEALTDEIGPILPGAVAQPEG